MCPNDYIISTESFEVIAVFMFLIVTHAYKVPHIYTSLQSNHE